MMMTDEQMMTREATGSDAALNLLDITAVRTAGRTSPIKIRHD